MDFRYGILRASLGPCYVHGLSLHGPVSTRYGPFRKAFRERSEEKCCIYFSTVPHTAEKRKAVNLHAWFGLSSEREFGEVEFAK
ncbi:hypothetical protein SLA2020_062730 [Shorea laevis]